MGMYDRYKKKGIDGFRELVRFFETTPPDKFDQFVQIGMKEDEAYCTLALKYMYKFEDLITCGDFDFNQIFTETPPMIVTQAWGGFPIETRKELFNRLIDKEQQREILKHLKDEFTDTVVQKAQFRTIQVARELEKEEKIDLKRIPLGILEEFG